MAERAKRVLGIAVQPDRTVLVELESLQPILGELFMPDDPDHPIPYLAAYVPRVITEHITDEVQCDQICRALGVRR